MDQRGSLQFNELPRSKKTGYPLESSSQSASSSNQDSRYSHAGNKNEIIKEGQKEAQKEIIKEEVKNKQQTGHKLDVMLNKSSNVLIKLSSIWPFDFFPKDIIVDTNKISIIYREFFFTERRRSILIKNVTDVFVDVDLLFASIKLIDRSYAENVLEIKFLPKADAQKARRIIQGLVVAVQNGIDLNAITTTELLSKIEELGKTNVDS